MHAQSCTILQSPMFSEASFIYLELFFFFLRMASLGSSGQPEVAIQPWLMLNSLSSYLGLSNAGISALSQCILFLWHSVWVLFGLYSLIA